MNNKFINYNGETLLHTQNKKTKVEIRSIVGDQSQIEKLKQQEQEIITELNSWETKFKKVDRLLGNLREIELFSTKLLAEEVAKEKNQEQPDNWAWEYLLKNKVEFALKFEPTSEAFYELIFQKTESQVKYLKSQLDAIQGQLAHQERIFARIEIRRQGRILLTCEYKKSIGCLGVWKCDNCRANYSADNNQAAEISQ